MTVEEPVTPAAGGTVDGEADGGLGHRAAAALVFGSSAAVLVVEIVALRLLAPYLGLTLETSTLVIGIALAAIASAPGPVVGWPTGSRRARALGPLLAVSGVAVALTPFAVRAAAACPRPGAGAVLVVAALASSCPGSLLAAVTPMVTKLRLTSLAETGTVVGRLSGHRHRGRHRRHGGHRLRAHLPGAGQRDHGRASACCWSPRRSLVERAHPRAAGRGAVRRAGRWSADWPRRRTGRLRRRDDLPLRGRRGRPARPSGRMLRARRPAPLLRRPRRPAPPRVRLRPGAVAAVVDTAFPARTSRCARTTSAAAGSPCRATWPRPARARRSLVSEIDPGVVGSTSERLGLRTGAGLERAGRGRPARPARLADGSQDLVVGDAFGGVSVPWHLTTREALGEVDRVLRPDGVYVAQPHRLAPLGVRPRRGGTLRDGLRPRRPRRAHAETLAGDGRRQPGGWSPPTRRSTPPRLQARLGARGADWRVIDGAELAGWIGDAPVLTDDYAPVDQLLTPYRRPAA